MTRHLTPETLMGHLDGELTPEADRGVAAHLAECAECRREYTVFQQMKEDLMMARNRDAPDRSVWDAVNARITRPVGWILLVAGLVVWSGWAVWLFITSPTRLFEKLTIGAVVVGLACLLASVAWERYRDWRTDPYRKIER
jgi:anti-sigma factor RsiW